MHRVVIHAVRTAGLVLLAAVVVGPAQSAAPAPTGEIAVVRVRDGRAEIVLRDLGGDERVVTRGRNPSWSPDGNSLAFERDGAVWIVSADGGGERRVAAGGGPVWSPDGAEFVLADRGTLRIVRLLDGQVRTLGAGQDPAWSSRGAIAFTRAGGLSVIDVAGGPVRRLTSGKKADSDPSWSSDGARLVFVREGAVVARAPERGARALFLAGPTAPATDPAWSPDGRYLVFSSGGQLCAAQRNPEEPEYQDDPWVRQRLTPVGVSYSQPAWRPHPGFPESGVPAFRPARLSSTADCDADPYYTFEASRIDPDKGHPNSLVVVMLELTNETRSTIRDVWLVGYRDGNRLVGVSAAKGRCRKPSHLEWECAFGSLRPRETVTVEVRYRGRYSPADGVFLSRPGPSPHDDPSLYSVGLDIRSIELCDIVGTAGNDVLRGTTGDDRICGFGGDDILRGGDGSDELRGGAGNDRLVAGRGLNALFGDAGDDRLFGGARHDTLEGGTGADRLDGGSGPDVLLGNGGNDLFIARDSAADVLNGGAGFDSARVDAGLRDRVIEVERLLR